MGAAAAVERPRPVRPVHYILAAIIAVVVAVASLETRPVASDFDPELHGAFKAKWIKMHNDLGTADQVEAAALMKQGRADAAAQLLERLLDDYPGASVSIRLKLADAYEQAQRLGRAAGVLKVAMKLTSDVAQRARIRERINHLDAAFPNLDGASAYVAADVDEFMRGDLDTVKAWIEELFAASRIRLVGVKFGVGDTTLSQQLATARKAGAKWFVTVKLRKMPLEATKSVYDAVLHQVRFECSVRLRSTENEGMLSSKSATERGLAAARDMAARSAAKCALRSALRQCFLALVSSASSQ